MGQEPGGTTVYALTDTTGNGVLYSAHCYSSKGLTVGCWDPYVTIATSSVPVDVEEFGAQSLIQPAVLLLSVGLKGTMIRIMSIPQRLGVLHPMILHPF